MTIAKTDRVKKSATERGTFYIEDIHKISHGSHELEIYKDVIESYMKNLVDYILDTGIDVKLNRNVGEIGMRKEKIEYIVRDNGKVKTNCMVDLKETMKERAVGNIPDNVFIRHLEMENTLKPLWNKGRFKNSASYYFKPDVYLREKMYYKAIANDTININELHKDRKFNRKDK